MSPTKCVFTYVVDVPANYRCPEHHHDCCEIVYCVGSEGILLQDGKQLPYSDGSIFVYQPGGSHVIVNRLAGRHICVGIASNRASKIPAGVWEYGSSLKWLFDRIALAAPSASALKSERMDYLCGLIALETYELVPPDADRDLAPAMKVKAIIDESFAQDLDIASLARLVYLSPDYFRYLFKREVGLPVIQYLIAKRIDHAKTLLTDSPSPIRHIASECGFSSPYYFSRAFKRATGESPQDYRRNRMIAPISTIQDFDAGRR